jgi:hypothetical protein
MLRRLFVELERLPADESGVGFDAVVVAGDPYDAGDVRSGFSPRRVTVMPASGSERAKGVRKGVMRRAGGGGGRGGGGVSMLQHCAPF